MSVLMQLQRQAQDSMLLTVPQYTFALSVTAAGTTINDATQLTAAYVQVVSGGDGAKGVKLFMCSGAKKQSAVLIKNNAGANLLVYPGSIAQTINGGAGGAATTIAANKVVLFIADSATDWTTVVFS